MDNSKPYVVELTLLSIHSNVPNPTTGKIDVSTRYYPFNEDGVYLGPFGEGHNPIGYKNSMLQQAGDKTAKVPKGVLLTFDHLKLPKVRTRGVHTRILQVSIFMRSESGDDIRLVDQTPDLTQNHIFGTCSFSIQKFDVNIYRWTIEKIKNDEGVTERHNNIELRVTYPAFSQNSNVF